MGLHSVFTIQNLIDGLKPFDIVNISRFHFDLSDVNVDVGTAITTIDVIRGWGVILSKTSGLATLLLSCDAQLELLYGIIKLLFPSQPDALATSEQAAITNLLKSQAGNIVTYYNEWLFSTASTSGKSTITLNVNSILSDLTKMQAGIQMTQTKINAAISTLEQQGLSTDGLPEEYTKSLAFIEKILPPLQDLIDTFSAIITSLKDFKEPLVQLQTMANNSAYKQDTVNIIYEQWKKILSDFEVTSSLSSSNVTTASSLASDTGLFKQTKQSNKKAIDGIPADTDEMAKDGVELAGAQGALNTSS